MSMLDFKYSKKHKKLETKVSKLDWKFYVKIGRFRRFKSWAIIALDRIFYLYIEFRIQQKFKTLETKITLKICA